MDPAAGRQPDGGICRRAERRGKYWLGIRTACEPLFHSAALASYAPMMNAAVDRLLGKLAATAHGGEGEACFAWCPVNTQAVRFASLCDSVNCVETAGVCVSQLLKGMSMDVIGDTGGSHVWVTHRQEPSRIALSQATPCVLRRPGLRTRLAAPC